MADIFVNHDDATKSENKLNYLLQSNHPHIRSAHLVLQIFLCLNIHTNLLFLLTTNKRKLFCLPEKCANIWQKLFMSRLSKWGPFWRRRGLYFEGFMNIIFFLKRWKVASSTMSLLWLKHFVRFLCATRKMWGKLQIKYRGIIMINLHQPLKAKF